MEIEVPTKIEFICKRCGGKNIRLEGSMLSCNDCFPEKPERTDLKDITGKIICIGDTVEWDDPEGKRTAKVVGSKHHVGFKCFKNTDMSNWAVGSTFSMDNFAYKETHHYLKIIGGEPNSSHS